MWKKLIIKKNFRIKWVVFGLTREFVGCVQVHYTISGPGLVQVLVGLDPSARKHDSFTVWMWIKQLIEFYCLIGFADVSTDGKWCYIVFWVTGKPGMIWSLLKKRLLEACPSVYSANTLMFYRPEPQPPKPADVFLLKFCCHDRQGLLHGKNL